jgi:hypothetical protein
MVESTEVVPDENGLKVNIASASSVYVYVQSQAN